jgi:serine/threonine-protein kinase
LWRSDKPGARQALEHALTLEPHNADAHRGLGEILRSDRNLREAEIEFEKALAIRPEDWELQMLAGAVKFDQRRFADAEQAFKRSIGLAPDNPLPYRSLAGVCQMQNRTDEAVALLQKSLSIKPEAGAYNNYGALLFRKGLYHQAVQAFEQAVALRANNYMYWAQLGEGYWQIADKRDKSQEAFQRAIQLLAPQLERTPGDLNLRSRMALYRAKRGESAGALLELSRIPGLLDLEDPVLLGRAIRVYELIGRRQQALAVLERMITREYPVDEVRTDTDLQGLREDVRFHRLMLRVRPADGR